MGRHRKVSFLLGWQPHEGHRLGITSIAPLPFAPSGVHKASVLHGEDCVVTGGRDGTVRLWCRDHCLNLSLFHGDCVNSIAVVSSAPAASLFATGGSDNAVVLHRWSASPFQPDRTILETIGESAEHSDAVKRVAAAESAAFYSASLDSTIRKFSVETASVGRRGGVSTLDCVSSHSVADAPLYSLCVLEALDAAGGNVVAAGTAMGGLFIADTRSGKKTDAIIFGAVNAHTGVVRDLLPFSRYELLSASSDGTMKLWDARSQRYTLHTVVHADAVWCLCPFPGAPSIALSAGRDATVVATNFARKESRKMLTCEAPVLSLGLSTARPSDPRRGKMPGPILYVGTTQSTVKGYCAKTLMSSGSPAGAPLASRSPSGSGLQRSTAGGTTAAAHGVGGYLPPPSPTHQQQQLVPWTPLIAQVPRAGDPRKLMSPHAPQQAVRFSTEGEAKLWCSSCKVTPHRGSAAADSGPPEVPATVPAPVVVLSGVTGIVECLLLASKRHVLVRKDDDRVSLFDLLLQSELEIPASVVDASKADSTVNGMEPDGAATPSPSRPSLPKIESRLLAHLSSSPCRFPPLYSCASWCVVEPRWGGLCVTLTAEEAFGAIISEWELLHGPGAAPPWTAEVTPTPYSIQALPRRRRKWLRKQPPVMIAERMIASVFSAWASDGGFGPAIAVWALQLPTSSRPPSGHHNVVRYATAEEISFLREDDDGGGLPAWVKACIESSEDSGGPDGSRASQLLKSLGLLPRPPDVSIDCQPLEKSIPEMPRPKLTVPRHYLNVDLCAEIIRQLENHLVKIRSLTIQKLNKAVAAQFGEDHCICVTEAGSASPGDGDPDSKLWPEEIIQLFVSLPAAESPTKNPPLETIRIMLDPYMSVSTGFQNLRPKGVSALQVKYRLIHGLALA